MTQSLPRPEHPGDHVRKSVIPEGMSVTAAAKRLGVGRPALSNFLNGNSSLSPEMAMRLEKTFGADSSTLLAMQLRFDEGATRAHSRVVAVRAFVPSFLTIKARHIEDWAARQIEARSSLSVLLRKLVHSTGLELRRVDFPGYDNAQRRGSDGYVEADSPTPWIPEGHSHWEFGTDKGVRAKADSDFAARSKSVDPVERARRTFVFVTPRNWPAKTAWQEEKQQLGEWRDVRALDASDLEQWLEQSVTAQIWLAEQLGLPTQGYETLDCAWVRWSSACEPELSSGLFASAVATHRKALKEWIEGPGSGPLLIAADSRDEALAFLACVLDDEELQSHRARTAVFSSADALRPLVASSVPFVPILVDRSAERELGEAGGGLQYIAYRPRNATDAKPDIVLDLLRYDDFERALREMGLEKDDIDRLDRESGRSPTILRRRLARSDAIKRPEWADEDGIARALVPMVLIGAWHAAVEADREIVSYVTNREYDDVETDVARLLRRDESPLWAVDRYRGIASKLDALFAVSSVVTPSDLNRFLEVAEYVLSESDPALELPEENRRAAGLYGKTREHSGALREGVCETLALLAVHGAGLFRARLGVDLEARVSALIRTLLTPLTLEKLRSHDRDLPRYAEAAPDAFLRIIEEDLRSDQPIVLGLLRPVTSGALWASPLRTGLLWGLECIAWNPQTLPRVAAILARLSQTRIDDNWANKPIASLNAIFRSWLPQTAASLEQRADVLRTIAQRCPEVGWGLCLEQLRFGPRMGEFSYRPRWRGDASGAGRHVSQREDVAFRRVALDLAVAWPSHDEGSLGDLVECHAAFLPEDQVKVWDLVDSWSSGASEPAKAKLRERIRRVALTRRSRLRNLDQDVRDRARQAYEQLTPADPVLRHAWLFADQWVPESAGELDDEELDYRQREARIDELRRSAMAEIWREQAFAGVRSLLEGGSSAWTVGCYAAVSVPDDEQRIEFMRSCMALDGALREIADQVLRGFLAATEADVRGTVLVGAADGLGCDETARVYSCAPFESATWRLLDSVDAKVRDAYWARVFPSWDRRTQEELCELIDRLMDAGRPRAAFHAVHMDVSEIETTRLVRLLRGIASGSEEPEGHFLPREYDISAALNALDGRVGVTPDDLAQLELLYVQVLDGSSHGIPNLERRILATPSLFVQAVALIYRRSDGREDPPEWRLDDPEKRSAAALTARRVLDQLARIPGTDANGIVDRVALGDWLADVRRLCRECGRAEVGDQHVGQLLAKAPGEAGTWPCEAVCEVLESAASKDVAVGFRIGVLNSRGVHARGIGGAQEREFEAKYRAFADRARFKYPFVGSVLDDIAESYRAEARWHDSREDIEQRLGP